MVDDTTQAAETTAADDNSAAVDPFKEIVAAREKALGYKPGEVSTDTLGLA